jgi:acrosin
VTIDTEGEADTLTFNDAATTDPRTVSVLTDRVGFGGDSFFGVGGFVFFAGVDAMTLNAGTGHDTVNVFAVNLGKTLTVNAGAGNDTVNVDSNGTLSGGTANDIKGALTINGGAGTNTVTVNDSSESANTTVTVTPMGATSGFVDNLPGDNLFGAAAASLSYTGVNLLNLSTGSGDDLIKLTPASTTAGTKFFVRAGAGADVLDIVTAVLVSPVWAVNPNGSGLLTSSNRAPVEWTGVETVM